MLGNSANFSIVHQLYMGDISGLATEQDVHRLTSPFGEVISIKLLRSPSTHSFAFISFKDASSVTKARRELNGASLLNSTIRVCRVTADRDPQANIFVKNIPSGVTLQQLEDHFSSYGAIISSKICFDKSGRSLGYGFLQFERRERAKEAIDAINGSVWKDSTLTVTQFLPLASRGFDSKKNLYIRGFPLSYSQEDIERIFGEFGEIGSVGLMTSKGVDGDRAFGFVSFIKDESAAKACSALHEKKESEFEWYVVPHMTKYARRAVLRDIYLKKIEDWKRKNLYIKNLHKVVCEIKLRDICAVYGTITSLKLEKIEHIKYNAEGDMTKEYTSKGIGFVCYELESSANTALKELQEKMIEGQKLYVAKWKPRLELKRLIMAKQVMRKTPAVVGGFQASPNIPQQPPRIPVFSSNPRPLAGFPLPRIPVNQPPQFLKRMGFDRDAIRAKLYPLVCRQTNDLVAGKIIAMILDENPQIVAGLLTDESALKNKIGETVARLKTLWVNNPTQLALLGN